MKTKEIFNIFILCIMFLLLVTPVINAKTADDWKDEGTYYISHKNYEKALEAFDEALKIDPQDAPAWIFKGLALCGLGRYEEAIECFDESLEIYPQGDLAWEGKGFAFNKLGKTEEAEEAFEKAREIEEEKKVPGFGAVFATAGLLAVAYLLRRRK